MLRGKTILGVCAGRFHTVLYTRDCVFTFGLNAGQLGKEVINSLKMSSEDVVCCFCVFIFLP